MNNKNIKYAFYIMVLQILSTSYAYALSSECVDLYTFTIVQKIDDHTYEVAYIEDPSILRGILHTKKAIFHKPGKPVGIKIKITDKITFLPTKDGFTQGYGNLYECALTAVGTMYGPGNWSYRDLQKGEKYLGERR